jgi:branched-chain amino acid transport system permease protein
MESFILQTLNGISFAALLFLLASGFTLTFGLMRIVNMAHGALYMFGAYVGLSVATLTSSLSLALLSGGLASLILGFFCDKFFISKVGEDHLAQVLLTVGIAYVVGDFCLQLWGGDAQKLPLPVFLRQVVELPGGIYYPVFRGLLVFIGIVVGVILYFVYSKTQIGAAIRAGVDDREMVSATGINVEKLFIIVSALAAFLAGFSGVLGAVFLTIYPGAEWEILVFALVVVILGGLGSLEGAMVGALVVGLLDAYGRWLVPDLSYFVLFGPMALLLLVRPRGLFGKANLS